MGFTGLLRLEKYRSDCVADESGFRNPSCGQLPVSRKSKRRHDTTIYHGRVRVLHPDSLLHSTP